MQIKDPTGTRKCLKCKRLCALEPEAILHHKQTQCKKAAPPVPVDCHVTITGVLVEVLPINCRKLDGAFAAAAADSTDISNSSTGKWLYLYLYLCLYYANI